MKHRIISAILCLFILLSSASLAGCEDSPVCLPEDSGNESNERISFESDSETGSESESESEAAEILYPFIPITDIDDEFINAQADFSAELFKEIVKQREGNDSLLISPLSVALALAMTANGAQGETLAELEELFGMDIDKLNEELCGFVSGLPTSDDAKLHIANSIWFRDTASLAIKEDFVNTNKHFYNAELRKRPFDSTTVDEINSWVDENTDGMINELLDNIDPSAMFYLINALVFDAKWASQYNEYDIQEDDFTDIYGNITKVNMMYSAESAYISDEHAQGFIKRYKGGYSFVAILPDEDVSVYDYIAELDADKLLSLVRGATFAKVHARLPQFKHEYSIEMTDTLKAMGLEAIFSAHKADLGKMADYSNGDLAVSSVLHKTVIDLTDAGTKAAAVTSVNVYATSASPNVQQPIYITLDRPFVYMIIDNETSLPIFMGTVTEIAGN